MIRIGLCVTGEMAAAAVVRGETVLWSMSVPCCTDTVADDVAELLSEMPRHGWIRPRVFVALGAPYARTKTVRGLPATNDAKAVARLIALTPERFFIGVGSELRTTGVRLDQPGEAFVAALDAAILASTQHAVEEAGFRLSACTALDVALGPETPHGMPPVVAGAISVATVGRHEVVSYRPPARDASQRRVRMWRIGVAVAIIAAVLWGVTPGIVAWYHVRQARAIVASLARHRGAALHAKRELDDVTHALGAVSDFAQQRTSATLLLAQLSEALPTGSALSTLKMDSAGGMAIGVAPHAADIVHALESIPGITHVEILGPVSRDAGAVPVDRVTVHFQGAPREGAIRRPLPSEARS